MNIIRKEIRESLYSSDEVFYRYGNNKGLVANWGHSDPNEYKHLGNKSTFTFNPSDKIANISTSSDPLVTEDTFWELYKSDDGVKTIYDQLEKEEDGDLAQELFMDVVVAREAKYKNYDGVIFTTESGKVAMDLRNHTFEEIQNIYYMFEDPQEWKKLI